MSDYLLVLNVKYFVSSFKLSMPWDSALLVLPTPGGV